ncbi:MAG TPA: DUF2442 domain-containing protein [Longimicrobiaceae bacterium]|jgi:hypothetical protein|nr:DUF2442 domain-containing protein [Longimicrobiaceae bacterium]
MFLHVSRARVLDDHRLWVEFDNGVAKEVDLSTEMHGEVFEPLRSPEMFALMSVNEETGTVEWPNGADFAPEFLFRIGREVERVA